MESCDDGHELVCVDVVVTSSLTGHGCRGQEHREVEEEAVGHRPPRRTTSQPYKNVAIVDGASGVATLPL